MPLSKEMIELRVISAGIAERCQLDSDFVKQLVNNPRATLESVNVPSQYIGTLLGEDENQPEGLIGVCCASGCCLSVCIVTN